MCHALRPALIAPISRPQPGQDGGKLTRRAHGPPAGSNGGGLTIGSDRRAVGLRSSVSRASIKALGPGEKFRDE